MLQIVSRLRLLQRRRPWREGGAFHPARSGAGRPVGIRGQAGVAGLPTRPLARSVDLLEGDWLVEAALGGSTTGTRADPVIVRDGNRGRLVPVFQSLDRDNPKGAVAAEIISWLMNKKDVPLTAFTRGDANGDAAIDIGDAICAIEYLFGQSADPCKAKVPRCFAAADANDSGALDTADAIEILDHLFAHTGPLPAPSGQCGIDPTIDDLDCLDFGPCQ